MPDVVIKNPILNSHLEEQCRNFKLNKSSITTEIVKSRYRSSTSAAIAASKRRRSQNSHSTADQIQEIALMNRTGSHADQMIIGTDNCADHASIFSIFLEPAGSAIHVTVIPSQPPKTRNDIGKGCPQF